MEDTEVVTMTIAEKDIARTLRINLLRGERTRQDMSNIPAYGLWVLVNINSLMPDDFQSSDRQALLTKPS